MSKVIVVSDDVAKHLDALRDFGAGAGRKLSYDGALRRVLALPTPVTSGPGRRPGVSKYPFATMEVGEAITFKIPVANPRAFGAALAYARRGGKVFRMPQSSDTGYVTVTRTA